MASPLNRPGLRAAAASAALTLVALSANVPAAQAIPPPSVDPAMVPADARPGPDQPMRRSNSCSTPITVRNPDVAQLAPGFNLVNISKAWQYSTGNGVPVAVIDTGVSPNPRLPVVPGGDYIMGEDGLSDCDAHGTVVSSIIAAAPLGILPMPRAMPATAAFLAPARTLFRCQPVVGRGWRLVPLPVLHRSRRGRAAGRVRVFQCTVRNADTVELHLKAPLNSRKAPTKTPWGATHV